MILLKYIKLTILLFLCLLLIGCNPEPKEKEINSNDIYLKVLGTIQDGGIPHLGCNKKCCKDYFKKGYSKKRVVSLGISDLKEKKKLFNRGFP